VDTVEVHVAAKRRRPPRINRQLAMPERLQMNIVEWVKKTVPNNGAGWCPAGMLGIGIGVLLKKRCFGERSP